MQQKWGLYFTAIVGTRRVTCLACHRKQGDGAGGPLKTPAPSYYTPWLAGVELN